MSRKNKNKNKCTKKQAQRQRRIQDAVISVLHTPNHRVYKSWEDCQETVVETTSQDQDTVVETKQDQNNVAPKQTQYTSLKTSNKILQNPQTSNQNQKDNKQDQNNGDDGVRDQQDKQLEDNQSDNYSDNPDRQENSDMQDKNREDNPLQGNQKDQENEDLQNKQNKQENHQENLQEDLQENLQDDLVETNNQDEHWGEDRAGGFYINASATREQALEIALKATEADFDPANRIFFTYGASVPEKMTRLALGNKKNNNQGRKRMAGAAAICKQPSTENNRVSWHGQQWTLGYSETTSVADAELVAISGCLSVAAEELRLAKNKTAPPKVTIITYDQDATDKIAEVLHWDPKTQRHPEATQALVEIVQKARSLSQSVGAVIELLCVNKCAVTLKVRGQSGPVIMRGNQYAENAAWKAATTPGIKLPSCSQMGRLN